MSKSHGSDPEVSDQIRAVVKTAPASAIVLAWQLVVQEAAVVTSQGELDTAEAFVNAVRQLRDDHCIDRTFANDLEKLARMLRHSQAVKAAGREIDTRNAKQYVALAVTAAEKLHGLHLAA